MDYYSAIKINKVLICVATRVNLKNHILHDSSCLRYPEQANLER